uniref:Bicarbonate transporter-like transmembrane domain-containing protein n=1 Tax=Chenopodium quinoa TaxID=63459 RepID=A0A803LEH2_CHEQI
MDYIKAPFNGIRSDVRGRLACYKQDWVNGFKHGIGILGPAASIFFASALPAIAFGELLNKKTGRKNLSSVQTLTSAAICGLIQTIFGGQPLLIQGVAEPTVLMYTFLYNYAKKRDDLNPLFLAWTAWVCVWTSLLLLLMSIFNLCAIIDRITRIAEELIEMLISVLFIQEAIRGIISEFQVPKGKDDESNKAYNFEWLYANGLLAILFSLGFIYTAFKTRKARSWLYGTGFIRNFIKNFGVPMMILVWAGLSYAVPSKVPSGIPRRLFSPHPWDSWDTWTIASEMGDVPTKYIFGAFIPGSMVAILFFFEHNVASKMAQQKEFNLKHPSAYHYDLFLLGLMIDKVVKELENLKEVVMKGESDGKTTFDPDKHIENHIPVRVNEQRLSNLLQSLLLGAAVFAMPALKRLPSSLLWGYIAYVAIDSLPGNQFWDRIRLIFVNKSRLHRRNMDNIKAPFRGITSDIRGRLSCYKQDWTNGFKYGVGILTPAASIFFASALPAIAFGELLKKKTGGSLGSVQTISSAAICGVLQSVIGGQPLLIQGVAEPTVLMYTFLYNFAKQKDDLKPLFLAWTAWVCVWASVLLVLMAIFNACVIIDRFTRIAEEFIEMLIAVLFIQEAIKGIISEFHVPKGKDVDDIKAYEVEWLYSNGLLAVIFSLGFIYTAFKSRNARSWWYGTGCIRNFIANFGVPLIVLGWTALSYGVPSKVPSEVPRRLFSPHPWDTDSLHPWTIAKKMGDVPRIYIAGAFIPGLMVAGLFFFEQNVASKMTQQRDFNLKNPSSYHYDIFILGLMTLVCGLLGLPPSYALIPHSPMHTKALAVLKRQFLRRKMVESAKASIHERASSTEIYGNMQAIFLQMDMNKLTNGVVKELEDLKQVVMKGEIDEKNGNATFDPEKHIENYLPVRVNEQRLSNLIQSLLLAISVFAMPALKRIPSSLLWGYLAYMAFDSLPGNQFWERIILLLVNKSRLHKYFEPHYLHELDAHEYEEVLGNSRRSFRRMSFSFKENGTPIHSIFDNEEEMEEEFSDSEVLDELTTHRGELKIRTMSFRSERWASSGRKEVKPRAMSFRHDLPFKVHPEDIV